VTVAQEIYKPYQRNTIAVWIIPRQTSVISYPAGHVELEVRGTLYTLESHPHRAPHYINPVRPGKSVYPGYLPDRSPQRLGRILEKERLSVAPESPPITARVFPIAVGTNQEQFLLTDIAQMRADPSDFCAAATPDTKNCTTLVRTLLSDARILELPQHRRSFFPHVLLTEMNDLVKSERLSPCRVLVFKSGEWWVQSISPEV
jgi:hypothetical protein